MPIYEHDCDNCKFLATVQCSNTVEILDYDLYYCENEENEFETALVARFSDYGPDYNSMSINMVRAFIDPWLYPLYYVPSVPDSIMNAYRLWQTEEI